MAEDSRNPGSGLDELKFEDAMTQLEGLVDKMESGDLPLDDMLKAYEKGCRLAAVCNGKLAAFEKKIEILAKETANGGEWQELKTLSTDRRDIGGDSSDAPF